MFFEQKSLFFVQILKMENIEIVFETSKYVPRQYALRAALCKLALDLEGSE